MSLRFLLESLKQKPKQASAQRRPAVEKRPAPEKADRRAVAPSSA
jgi:hypothetical protein